MLCLPESFLLIVSTIRVSVCNTSTIIISCARCLTWCEKRIIHVPPTLRHAKAHNNPSRLYRKGNVLVQSFSLLLLRIQYRCGCGVVVGRLSIQIACKLSNIRKKNMMLQSSCLFIHNIYIYKGSIPLFVLCIYWYIVRCIWWILRTRAIRTHTLQLMVIVVLMYFGYIINILRHCMCVCVRKRAVHHHRLLLFSIFNINCIPFAMEKRMRNTCFTIKTF